MRYLIEFDGNLYLVEESECLGMKGWYADDVFICRVGDEDNKISVMDLSIKLGWLQ